MSEISVIFFDLGETLGDAVLSGNSLEAFKPYGFAPKVLSYLKAKELRLGVISNTGTETGAHMEEVLREAKLWDFFEPALLIFSSEVGMTKKNPVIFLLAAGRAEIPPDQCLFVGEDPGERDRCRNVRLENGQPANMKVCPHPLLVEEKLAGHAIRYARIEPGSLPKEAWKAALRKHAQQGKEQEDAQRVLVPLHLLDSAPGSLFAIMSQQALNAPWDAATLGSVKRLGDEAPDEESDLYLVESAVPNDADPRRRRVLDTVGEQLLVAVPNAEVLEEYHPDHHGHGDKLRLMVKPHLLDPPAAGLHAGFVVVKEAAASAMQADDLSAWDKLTATTMKNRVERYSGQLPLEDGVTTRITSRNTAHLGNLLAVEALEREFATIGGDRLQIRRHSFSHLGRTLFNIVAKLPGVSEDVVIISAHLDTTAEASEPYDPETDPAPGADDDASGMSAVLSIAERILALTDGSIPAKTVQFVLFNDEENGLVGSQVYARFLRNAGTAIAGVFQMDMIGYNVNEPRDWEIHIGVERSPEVEAMSRMLADAIAAAAEKVAAGLPAPQIYDSTTGDPATGRSDHGSFHQQGYPACVVSEDYFGGPAGSSPPPEANPHYHKKSDLMVDPEYAALIARAVGAAAWAWISEQTLPAALREPTPAKRAIHRGGAPR